jgi:microcompartment protein CcmL/EutN
LAKDLGGKAYFIVSGELPDVQDSLKISSEYVRKEGMLTAVEVIPSPHPELIEKGLYW